MIHVFYHRVDHDGKCSGAIVKSAHPDAVLHPINYNEPFPWKILKKEDTVFVVDFCLVPFSDMIRLNRSCHLIWIDHHISAIEDHIRSKENISGLRRVGHSGCMLTWEYCYPGQPLPKAVWLLGNYDVFKLTREILDFEYGMRSEDTDPNRLAYWDKLFNNDQVELDRILHNGSIIHDYVDRVNEGVVENAFAVKIDGLPGLAINSMRLSSLVFQSAPNLSDYKVLICYGFNGRNWSVSLYTNHPAVDVSKIAAKYGGGGHKGASGFSVDKSPIPSIMEPYVRT